MAKRSVDVVVKAHDQLSTKFGKMDKSSRALAKTFKFVLGGSIAYASMRMARFGLQMAKNVLGEFVASEKAGKKLEAVLKATGHAAGFSAEQLKKRASALQDMTTFDNDAIVNTQALLATFKNVSGDVFDEAIVSILNMSEVLEQDLKSSAIQLGKALNDPIRGVSALSRVGVSFTAQQQAQIKTLAASGRMMEAQTIILAELQSEFGGAAVKAAEGTGRFKQLDNAVSDLKKAIGSGLAPVLTTLAEDLLPEVQELTKDLSGFIEDNKDEISAWAKTLSDDLVPALQDTVGLLKDAGKHAGVLATIMKLSAEMTGIPAIVRGHVALFGDEERPPGGKPFYRPVGAAAAEAAAMADQAGPAGPSGSRPMRPGEMLAQQVAQLAAGALTRALSGQKVLPAMPKHPMQSLIEAMGLGDWQKDLRQQEQRRKAVAFLAGGQRADARSQSLMARESWLVTGRAGRDPAVETAKATKQTAEGVTKLVEEQKRAREEARRVARRGGLQPANLLGGA